MAGPAKLRGVHLLLKIGNGAAPEVFTPYCSVNSDRGIQFTADTTDEPDIDCTNLDKLAWLVREKKSLSATLNGSGTLNVPDVPDMFAFVNAVNSRNCKVILDVAGGYEFDGAFHLTSFEITGTYGEKAKCTLKLDSDGAVTGQAYAPPANPGP